MLDHITIPVSNYAISKLFYTKALAPLGYQLLMEVEGFAGFGLAEAGGPIATFWIYQNQQEIYKAHFAFTSKSQEIVNQFYAAAMEAGGKDNGKPGIRQLYHPHYYGAFVFDPDGYNIEAVCHNCHF